MPQLYNRILMYASFLIYILFYFFPCTNCLFSGHSRLPLLAFCILGLTDPILQFLSSRKQPTKRLQEVQGLEAIITMSKKPEKRMISLLYTVRKYSTCSKCRNIELEIRRAYNMQKKYGFPKAEMDWMQIVYDIICPMYTSFFRERA